MYIQSSGIVRTIYSTIFKDILVESGILIHFQLHSQACNQREKSFLILERKGLIVFLTKHLSKCPSSTSPSSCSEKFLVAYQHSGIIIFTKCSILNVWQCFEYVSDISRVFLGRPVTSWSSPSPFPPPWLSKFLNLVPPDALKMHSLAVPVLRFLCKTFSKLRKLNNEALFSVNV